MVVKQKNKNKKNLIVSIIILTLLVGVYLFNINTNPSQPSLVREGENASTGNIINVNLEVLGKSYQAKVLEDSSVYDLMVSLRNNKINSFTFNYKEYSGLGIFIDEINGVKGGDSGYWIYYINNKEASVGVSNYILKEGDDILWKLE